MIGSSGEVRSALANSVYSRIFREGGVSTASITRWPDHPMTRLSSVCSSDALAEVAALHFDFATHLVQARAHAFANAIAKRLVSGDATQRSSCFRSGRRKVSEVGRNDRRALVIVASVEDVADGVPHPFGRLYRAEFIEHEHFGLEYWLENFQLRSLDARVVGVLYLLQQLTIIVKKAGGILLDDQLAQNAHGQMRFPYTDRSE